MRKTQQQPEAGARKAYAAPVAAILSALGSLACCVPLAFLGALGAAGASALFAAVKPWLLVVSAALLAVGFVQLYRGGKSCRRSAGSVMVFWLAVVIFLVMLFFPQQVANLLAGRRAS